MRKPLLILGLGCIVTLTWIGYKHFQSSLLPAAARDEVGLIWQECPLSHAYFYWTLQEAKECFGHPMPLWSDDEAAAIYGERIGDFDFQLVIGRDVYRTDVNKDTFPMQEYTLYRNGDPIKTLRGWFGSDSPNRLLQNVDGKAVWEFGDQEQATVVYDGQDVRQFYSLDKAYRPYGLADKLIFIGQKDDKYFVVYDGFRIGPDFEELVIAYCCEPVLYSVQFGQGRYLFSGTRDGQHYLVEITASED